MRIYDLIAKKRDGGTHSREELEPSSTAMSAEKWPITRWLPG